MTVAFGHWLGDCEVGEAALFRRVEGKHNLVLWDARVDQLLCNTILSAIAMYPKLVADKVYVDEAAVDLSHALAANQHYKVTISFTVKNGLKLNITLSIWYSCMVAENALN